MEWMSSPAAWVALASLTFLEIVLGIDNIIFIAIPGRASAARTAQARACHRSRQRRRDHDAGHRHRGRRHDGGLGTDIRLRRRAPDHQDAGPELPGLDRRGPDRRRP